MSLSPINQTNLFSLDNFLSEFVELYRKKRLPTKILLSGDKGLGKSTLAFHLVNYILSINEEHPYIIKESKINPDNKSYKLVINGSNPNLLLVDTLSEKKNIDINQIRELINNLNKSSQILVGSIRQPQVISEAIKCGADIVTTQFQNFSKFLSQLKSDEANMLFQNDWNS